MPARRMRSSGLDGQLEVAEARRHGGLHAVARGRARHERARPVGRREGLPRVALDEDHAEAVAGQAGHDVLVAHALAQRLRDLGQDAVGLAHARAGP